MRFSRFYFFLFIVFFVLEFLIAVYINDDFIRPYLGDTFVVILIYCFIRSFLSSPVKLTIYAVLLFSFSIEILQYFDFVNFLGLESYKLARIIIGTSFAWEDFIAYTFGAIAIGVFEYSCIRGDR